MTAATRAACRSCFFWRPAKRGKAETWSHYDGGKSYLIEHAQCRRRAPVAIVEFGQRKLAEAKWPETNADDWCGDHAEGKAP